MRPTLLRVLTDLYLQKPTHSTDDERYFTELALRLIDATDIGARSSLAARLASYASAPHDVVERLARDEIAVAEPILRCSPCLTAADLAAIAKDCGPAHAKVIASRNVPALSEQPETTTPSGALENSIEASELTELFYTASSMERRLILINLEYAASSPLPLAVTLERRDVWRLELAALQHNLEAVMREFERALGISHLQARRVIQDELGEPVVVAAKAMELPSDVLQRMLLFVNPRIGELINRVYELAELYGEITVDAARRMIAILRDANPDFHRASARPARTPGLAQCRGKRAARAVRDRAPAGDDYPQRHRSAIDFTQSAS